LPGRRVHAWQQRTQRNIWRAARSHSRTKASRSNPIEKKIRRDLVVERRASFRPVRGWEGLIQAAAFIEGVIRYPERGTPNKRRWATQQGSKAKKKSAKPTRGCREVKRIRRRGVVVKGTKAQEEWRKLKFEGLRVEGLRVEGLKVEGLKVEGLKVEGLRVEGRASRAEGVEDGSGSRLRMGRSKVRARVSPNGKLSGCWFFLWR